MERSISSLKEFNKQILYGELGGFFGVQIAAIVGRSFTTNSNLISWYVLIGSFIGGTLFFLTAKINQEKKENRFSGKQLIKELSYFTPVAGTLQLLVYLPILKISTYFFLKENFFVSFAAFFSQIFAFLAFLFLLNIYREILRKKKGLEI